MGCSGRVKKDDLRAEQKWDFISLNDFKSTSCLQPLAYGYLWLSLMISIAVYGVDTFTAINLLAFNKWSGEIQPIIPLNVSKWIFSICIILSWVNLGFEHLRAMRMIKRGAVADSFLDSLAVRLQSIRLGKGRGWRRFLVFAELTKSGKGTEYVALFTYFAFQSWIRIIFCQGPRQVINALTILSFFRAKFVGLDTHDVGSSILSFFKKIAFVAEENNQQAVILSGMVFTLVIWIFGALSLLLAVLFFVCFLWHYIPNHDGGLSGYCERKVNQRLARIVSVKVNKAIEEEERKRIKAEVKAVKKGEKPTGRQATLPTIDQNSDDKLPAMPIMNRSDTMSTLPQYSSRPGTPSSQHDMPAFELNKLEQKRPFGSRSITGASTATTTSYGSNAPLMSNASDMGYGRSATPAPSLPPLNSSGFPAMPQRTMTANSNASFNRGPGRMPSAMGDRGYTASPMSYDNQSPSGTYNQSLVGPYARPMPRAVDELNGRSFTPGGPAPSMGRRTPFDQGGRSSPAPTSFGDEYGRNSPVPAAFGPGSEYGRNSPAPTAFGPGSEYGRNSPAPTGYGPAEYGTASPASTGYDPDQYRRVSPAPMGSEYGRASPAPTSDGYGRTPTANRPTNMSQPSIDNFGRNSPGSSNMREPPSPTISSYQPYNPSIRSAIAAPRQNPAQQYRNMTDPGYGAQAAENYYNNDATPLQRPGTVTSQRPGIASSQTSRPGVPRFASPAPQNEGNAGFGGAEMFNAGGYRQ